MRFNNRRRNSKHPEGGRFNNNRNGGGQSKANLHRTLEKYLTSARDAGRGGDKVAAEGFYQHAEHYQRLINKLAPATEEETPPNGLEPESRSESLPPRRHSRERSESLPSPVIPDCEARKTR